MEKLLRGRITEYFAVIAVKGAVILETPVAVNGGGLTTGPDGGSGTAQLLGQNVLFGAGLQIGHEKLVQIALGDVQVAAQRVQADDRMQVFVDILQGLEQNGIGGVFLGVDHLRVVFVQQQKVFCLQVPY